MDKKKKYYVVWQGKHPGIYDTWNACAEQIKGAKGAKYKSFEDREEAEEAFRRPYTDYVPARKTPPQTLPKPAKPAKTIIRDSLCVDAACSGNPGEMEYQGVETSTGKQVFHRKFALGTNNIGEFLAIVHALALLKQRGSNIPVYSDSETALAWVRKKKCNSKIKGTPGTEELFKIVERAENWLANNTWDNPLLKWDTEAWGEIPADFGRK